MPLLTFADGTRLLYIHIPKTGGTSVFTYLEPRAVDVALVRETGDDTWQNISLHHVTLATILHEAAAGNPQFAAVRTVTDAVMATVRHPCMRMVSTLFFWHLIRPDHTPDQVYEVIAMVMRHYTKDPTVWDGHFRPQCEYVCDAQGELYPGIVVLKQESLVADLAAHGYPDFACHALPNPYQVPESRYMSYLNRASLDVIYQWYAHDFAWFHYGPDPGSDPPPSS